MKRIKILHLLTSLDFGGVEKYVLQLATRLDAAGYDVTVACSPRSARLDLLRDHGLKFLPIPHFQKSIHPWADACAYFEIFGLLRRERFDLVHTHMFKASVLGRAAAAQAGVPGILFTAHGFHFNTFTQPLLQWIAKVIEKYTARWCSDRVVTVSHTEARQALALGIIPAHKLRTVYPGVELAAGRPSTSALAALRRELGLKAGTRVIGTVGRLARQKAPLDLVRAAAELQKTRRDFRVLFVGDGPMRREVEAEIERHGLQSVVNLLGFRSDVERLLGLFDLFVLPSLFEGQPIAIMEAMAHGVPVLASEVNGVPEIVIPEKTGCLVPHSDPARLALAIAGLLDDEPRRRRLAKQALAHLRAHYNADGMAIQMQAIYRELLAEKQTGGTGLHHVMRRGAGGAPSRSGKKAATP